MIPVPITETPISVGVSRRETIAIEAKLMASRTYCSPAAMAKARLTTLLSPLFESNSRRLRRVAAAVVLAR
jgi:hypothetical protein